MKTDDPRAQEALEVLDNAFADLNTAAEDTLQNYATAAGRLVEAEAAREAASAAEAEADAAIAEAFGQLHEAVERTIDNYAGVTLNLLEMGGGVPNAPQLMSGHAPTLALPHASVPAAKHASVAPSVASVAVSAAQGAVRAVLPALRGSALAEATTAASTDMRPMSGVAGGGGQ